MRKRFHLAIMMLLVVSVFLSACAGTANNGGANVSEAGGAGANSENTENSGNSNSGNNGANGEEVVLNIPHYKTGQNVGAKFFMPLVERYNEMYAGQYRIVVEEVPQDDYAEKIKLLYQQKKLPALIEGGDKEFLENVVVAQGMFYDLKPWIDSKPAIKDILLDESVAYNTKDGKIFTLPLAVIRPIGIYYNKEMFEQAGIRKSLGQMSVDEFMQALDDLKAAGFTPLSLMTGENAWTTMLLASALMANEPGGAEILQSQERVYDYTAEPWVNTFAKIQVLLQDYTTDNAIGAAYADAANNFMNERTATIANGTWMIGDFSDTTKAVEGFDAKVGASLYPGGVAIATMNDYTWWIPSGLSEAETEAALAFLELMYSPEELETYMIMEGGNAPKLDTSADFESQLHPILAEFNQSVSGDLKLTVQSFENIWPQQIPNEFGKYLPKLADGSMTPEAFAEELTRQAAQFK